MNHKVIIITGTSRGIGRHLARHYCNFGHTVFGCSRSDPSFSHAGYNHKIVDIASEEEVVKWMRGIYKATGNIDVLLNNAGTASLNHFLTTPLESLERLTKINYFGTFICSREAAKYMSRQKKGRIVNFSSVASALNLQLEAAYASGKAAIESLTRITAKELAPFNITVNAVGPTPVETDLIKKIPQQNLDHVLQQQAFKRNGTMEDVSNVVDFFLDDKSNFITGQIIYLGGVNG